MATARTRGKRPREPDPNPGNHVDLLAALRSVPFFSSLSDDVRHGLLRSLRLKTYRAGERIIERDGVDKDVFFLTAGNAHVLNFSPAGRVVSYGTLESGDLFGEIAAIDGRSRSATVAAKIDCSVIVMSPEDFMRIVTSYKDCTLAVMRKHANIIRAGNDRIANFALLGAEQRICLELLRLAEPDPAAKGRFAVYPMPTQESIAGNVGVTRRTVARTFSRLSSDKVIDRKGKTLYIRNASRLEEIALS